MAPRCFQVIRSFQAPVSAMEDCTECRVAPRETHQIASGCRGWSEFPPVFHLNFLIKHDSCISIFNYIQELSNTKLKRLWKSFWILWITHYVNLSRLSKTLSDVLVQNARDCSAAFVVSKSTPTAHVGASTFIPPPRPSEVSFGNLTLNWRRLQTARELLPCPKFRWGRGGKCDSADDGGQSWRA